MMPRELGGRVSSVFSHLPSMRHVRRLHAHWRSHREATGSFPKGFRERSSLPDRRPTPALGASDGSQVPRVMGGGIPHWRGHTNRTAMV